MPIASRSPVRIAGSAEGTITAANTSHSRACATRATRSTVRSTLRTPKMVFSSSGQNEPKMISMTAGLSPMPKNRMASGISAMGGKERKICTDQSASRSSVR